jgi:hypothetical protein
LTEKRSFETRRLVAPSNGLSKQKLSFEIKRLIAPSTGLSKQTMFVPSNGAKLKSLNIPLNVLLNENVCSFEWRLTFYVPLNLRQTSEGLEDERTAFKVRIGKALEK